MTSLFRFLRQSLIPTCYIPLDIHGSTATAVTFVAMAGSYYFGVEIEMIAKPRKDYSDHQWGFEFVLRGLHDLGALGKWKVERDGSLRPGPGEGAYTMPL